MKFETNLNTLHGKGTSMDIMVKDDVFVLFPIDIINGYKAIARMAVDLYLSEKKRPDVGNTAQIEVKFTLKDESHPFNKKETDDNPTEPVVYKVTDLEWSDTEKKPVERCKYYNTYKEAVDSSSSTARIVGLYTMPSEAINNLKQGG